MLDCDLDFEFNGIHSSTFGIQKITMSSGMQGEEYYLASKTVNSFRLRNNTQSHLLNIDKEPLVIPMVLYLNGNVDFEKEQQIKEWLETDKYCKLKIGKQLVLYNAILQGGVNFMHDSIGDGYIEVSFLTNSPFRFSDEILIKGKSESNTVDTKISILNHGAITVYPVIKIISPGKSDGIEIRNRSTGDYFSLTGTYTDLTLNILNQEEELDSDGNFNDLYENHNNRFISLKKGRNDLEIKGSFYYEISYQNVYL